MYGNPARYLNQLICVNAVLGHSAPPVPAGGGTAPDALIPAIYDEIEPQTGVCMQMLSRVLTLYTGGPTVRKRGTPIFLAPENPW
jgi:hypothetical protein